jgi:Chalcone isomerase-like
MRAVGRSGTLHVETFMTLPRRSLLLLLASMAALPAWATRSITTEGLTFAGDIKLADTALQLNGVGWRAVAWVKGYAAGLYLPKKAGTEDQVIAQTGAKRLQLRLVQEVDAEEFVKAFVKGVNRNTPPADVAKLGDRVAQFNTVIRSLGKLKKQDVIDLDFIPGKGLVLSRNGSARSAPVPGEDLYAALLRCFIGIKPTDPELKIGLLGGPVG